MFKKIICAVMFFVALTAYGDQKVDRWSAERDSLLGKSNERWKVVLLHTNFGDIKFRLFDETPVYRDNFLELVRSGKLNNTLFFRVVKDFVVQGGDVETHPGCPLEQQGDHDMPYTLPAEINANAHFHMAGCVGSARMGDDENPTRRGDGSQFYFITGRKYTEESLNELVKKRGLKEMSPLQKEIYTTLGGAPWLDGAYTVFGQVISGMDVLDRIQNTPTDDKSHPIGTEVVLISAEVL